MENGVFRSIWVNFQISTEKILLVVNSANLPGLEWKIVVCVRCAGRGV